MGIGGDLNGSSEVKGRMGPIVMEIGGVSYGMGTESYSCAKL